MSRSGILGDLIILDIFVTAFSSNTCSCPTWCGDGAFIHISLHFFSVVVAVAVFIIADCDNVALLSALEAQHTQKGKWYSILYMHVTSCSRHSTVALTCTNSLCMLHIVTYLFRNICLVSLTPVQKCMHVWMRACAYVGKPSQQMWHLDPRLQHGQQMRLMFGEDIRADQGFRSFDMKTTKKKTYSFVSLWFLASSRPKRSEEHAAHVRYCLKCLKSCPSVEYVRVWLSANSWNMHVSASWLQPITSLGIFGSKVDITSLLIIMFICHA